MHQTVNLTSPTSVVRIHPLPPQNRGTHFGYLCFVCGVRGCFTEPQFGLPPQGGALPRLPQGKRQYPPLRVSLLRGARGVVRGSPTLVGGSRETCGGRSSFILTPLSRKLKLSRLPREYTPYLFCMWREGCFTEPRFGLLPYGGGKRRLKTQKNCRLCVT